MKIINRRFLVWGSAFVLFLAGSASAAYNPTEVENVQGTVNGTSIDLTWDPASVQDDVITSYKIYWGTNSVQSMEDFYTTDFVLTPADTKFTIPGLTPGTTYYIAVTAMNSVGDESENFSKEISVRIPALEGEGLKIIAAKQNAYKSVEVTFSAPVTVDPIRDGFYIIDLSDDTEVRIIGGVIQNEHVLLSMEQSLTPGRSYQITATSLVKDAQGTPIKSGITDTISFVADWTDAETTAKPQQSEIPTEDNPEDDLALLDETPLEGAQKDDIPDETADQLEFPDLTTPPLTETTDPIVLDTPDLFPTSSGTFDPDETTKPSAPITDTTPPMDATDFTADTSTVPTERSAILSWKKSLNISNDVVDQILYVRENLGDWDDGYSIGPNLQEIMLDVEDGYNYQVKIVTIDNSGNTSDGTTVSFSTKLPQSGPAGMFGAGVALLVLVVLGLTVARRRTT